MPEGKQAYSHSKTDHQSIAANVPRIRRDKYHSFQRADVEQASEVNEAAETMAARAGAGAQGEANAEGNRKQTENGEKGGGAGKQGEGTNCRDNAGRADATIRSHLLQVE